MPNAIVYVIVTDDNDQWIQNPTFSSSLPFVSIDFEGNQIGNPPQLTVPGGEQWMMGVQEGATITASAPGYTSDVVDPDIDAGMYAAGNNPEMPLRAILMPLGTWTWTGPTPFVTNTSPVTGVEATVDWKANYVVSGALQSFDQTAPITAEFALTQTGPWTTSPDGAASSLVNTQSATVEPGDSVPVAFGSFSQAWQWFEQATGVPYGPESQYISYSLAISITDNAGNTINVTPPTLIVQVSVPNQKLTDDWIAQTSFDLSIILGIAAAASGFWSFGIGTVIFGAAAIAAQVLAQAESQAAEDPPEPSLAFDRVERFQPRLVGEPFGPEMNSMRELLNCGLRVTEARRVLSITEGRLGGARKAGTKNDISRQLRHYGRVVAVVKADRVSVQRAGTNADREFAEVLETIRAGFVAHSQRQQHPNGAETTPPAGVNARVLRAFRTLHRHPAIALEVCEDALDNLKEELAGVFSKLANGIGEAINHIANDYQRIVRMAHRQ